MPDGEDEQVCGQVDEGAQPSGHADQVDEQQRLLFDDETWQINSLVPQSTTFEKLLTHC
jgi:hypothetical protein